MDKSSNFTPGEGIKRQTLNLIFVIDNSGSMDGANISAVNNAIRDVISLMPEIQADTADVEIKLSALKFSDAAEWVYPDAREYTQFVWSDLEAQGGTNLSDAYRQLTTKLKKESKGGIMPDFGGVAPIILLLTDGLPGSPDWPQALADLKDRGWFDVALKYALAIGIDGEDAMNVLSSFTGDSERVLKVYSAEALRKVIRVIMITASKVKSKMKTGAGIEGTANDQAQQEIKQNLSDLDGVITGWD
jgi:uncharacterized protein YegL